MSIDGRSIGAVDVPESTAGAGLSSDPPFQSRLEYGARQSRVQEIDFRRPTKFARELVRRLEHAHESFCRTASSGLSAELRTSLEMSVAGSEQLPYGTAMAETHPDSLLAVLNVAPLETEVAMVIDMPLALRLVDRLIAPLVLCIPYRSVEPIVGKLEHRHYDGHDVVDPTAAVKVREAISGVDVELRAEAGAVDMSASDVLALRVGDV